MRGAFYMAIWLATSCGSKDKDNAKHDPAPTPPAACEPARITFDGKPFAFPHGALATHKDDAWTVALFATTNAADGLHKPTDVTCDELLSSRQGADYVKITAFDDAPTVGALAYDFHAILASGMQTDIGPMKKCTPDAPCNTISPVVIARPDAPGAALEMCVSVNVRFTDNAKAEHVLAIDGRIRGTYCGVPKSN